MKLVTLFFIKLCLKYCLSISHRNDFQMIVDVIRSYDQPTAVVADVCWTSYHKSKLATMLTKERSINIQYTHPNKTIHINIASNNHLLFLIDLKCVSSKSFLNQASANNMFSKTYRWLVLGRIADIVKENSDLNILVESEFIIAEEDHGNYLLQTMYKIQPKGKWIREYYGTWTSRNVLNKSRDRMISNVMRRKNLQQHPVTVSIIVTDNRTRNDYTGFSNFMIDPATKTTYAVLTKLYEFINATTVVIFSGTWGYLINGTWSGMIGDIHSRKADLCGTWTFINKDRSEILNYITIPAGSPVVKIIFRKPPLSYQFNLFILPFTATVWCCLGGLVIIIIIILYINAKWDIKKYEDYAQKSTDATCLRAFWSDIIIFVVSAVSQQGSSNELKGTLGRLVMFLVFLTFLFFYTSYSANIVVLLQSTSDQIRTLTDLTNSKLEVGLEEVSYNKYYFSPSFATDPVRKAFYETKISPKGVKPNYMSLEDGVKRVQTKPFAFNMNTGSGYRLISQYFQEHEKCGLLEIDYIQGSKPWYCSKKDSPYNEMYKVGIFRIEEHGLGDRNSRLVFSKKPTCTGASGNFASVNMIDFYPVLLMLLYGMILAFALLVIEILVHRRIKIAEK